MTGSILYLGDTSLDTAAAYLAGLITRQDWSLDYVPSHETLSAARLDRPRSLFVISDYPAPRISHALQQRIVEQVRAGSGLLMIGGWESFHGLGGDWDDTPIGDVLPVRIGQDDDRLNCDHPVFVRPVARHPILEALPWDDHPPLIGGLNRVLAKPEAEILLMAEHFQARYDADDLQLKPSASDPLMVVGNFGHGRTAALMTDVAPHWVGPLVDWGPDRVTAQAPGAEPVEVGNLYAQFIRQLLNWTAGTT